MFGTHLLSPSISDVDVSLVMECPPNRVLEHIMVKHQSKIIVHIILQMDQVKLYLQQGRGIST